MGDRVNELEKMKIKIAGYEVKIVVDKNLVANEARVGEYSPFEQKITIADGLTRQQMIETLIHEVLEAANDIYELDLDHDNQLCKMSVILHQIIVDNPQIINAYFACD